MTFFEYMLKYLKKDTPAGDLARDMLRDRQHFPITNDRYALINYLDSKNASEECLKTFCKCYERYERQENRRYGRNA